MATIATIPLAKIERIQLYVNTVKKADGKYKSLDDIMAETGADYGINGTFYSNWKPVMHFRADGVTYSSDQYNYVGLGWDSADARPVESKHKETVRNFLCGVQLVGEGKPCEKLYYNADVGGVRGRSAVALKGSSLMLYCVGDGEPGCCTPEELRSEMAALGVDYAVMLDGGSSSQCDFAGRRVNGARVVQHLILVYLKKEEEQVAAKAHLVYLDPGHGGSDTSNQSPDGTYKEHEFALDMAQRIRYLLLRNGVHVSMTRSDNNTSVALQTRAVMANEAKADLYVSIHSNAVGTGSWQTPSGLCVYTYAEGGIRDAMARAIIKRVKEKGIKTFGYELYHSKFAVLKYTSMPACLIECAFHTNRDDVAKLKDPAWRQTLAEAIAHGILDTLGLKMKAAARYRITIGEVADESTAQLVVSKLAELGITAKVEEVEA